MAYIPSSGSVVAFQGTVPYSVLGTTIGSVITVNQGSIAAVIVGGSVASAGVANQSVSGTVHVDNFSSVVAYQLAGSILATSATVNPAANQSVSGTVGASIIGLPPVNVTNFPTTQNVSGSVVAFQGTSPWVTSQNGSIATVIIGGSIAASFTPPANQSVSGTVQTQVQASVAVVIIGGSILTSSTANQSVSGTVVTNQGTSPWVVVGSVYQGVGWSGSVAATVTNTVTVVSSLAGGIFPISGSVAAVVTNFPTNQNVSGSVVAFQGSAPWANTNVGSVITVGQGSIAVNIIAGSISATFTPPANQSVSGTVGASIIGLAPVSVSNFPTNQNVSGSVVAFQGGTQITSIAGNVAVQGLNAPVASVTGNPVYTGGSDGNGSVAAFKLGAGREQIITGSIQGTVSVLGTVPVTQSGAWSTSIIGGASVFQAGTWSTSIMTNVITSIATAGQVMGSVAALQATNPWNVAGSVAAFIVGNASVITVLQSPSIVGTYAEDVPSTGADKGIFTLGIRNDTVASLVGADLDYTGWSTDSAGRHLVKPFAAEEVRLSTVSSVVSTSVTALFSSVTGLRNYVTDVWVANTGASATLVTFKDGSTSTLGFTIAPAGGGSNLPGLNFPMRTAPGQDFTYVTATATSVLYITAMGYKGP